MADLLSVLEKTQNPAELQNASKYLEEAARGNLPLFLKELSKSRFLVDPNCRLRFDCSEITVYF